MLIANRHSYININHSSGKSVPNQSGWTSWTSFHPPKLWRKQPFGTGKRRTKKQLAEFHMVSSLVTSLKIAVPMLLAIWGWFLAPTFDPWRSASMDWSELNPHFSSFHAHLWGCQGQGCHVLPHAFHTSTRVWGWSQTGVQFEAKLRSQATSKQVVEQITVEVITLKVNVPCLSISIANNHYIITHILYESVWT